LSSSICTSTYYSADFRPEPAELGSSDEFPPLAADPEPLAELGDSTELGDRGLELI